MRIFRRILKIFFVVVFVVSICLNVILGLSSDYSLVLKDNGTKRRQLANRAVLQLNNAGKVTFEDYNGDNKTKAIVSCVNDTEKTTDNLTCEQITYVYDDNNEVTKTVYFPGDGYKYVIDGDSKTKVAADDSAITTYVSGLYMGSIVYLYYMYYDTERPSQEYVSNFKTKLNFNFSNFLLTRNVSYDIKSSEDQTTKATLSFDSKDKLLAMKSGNSELKIKYNTTKFNYPSFNTFVEA